MTILALIGTVFVIISEMFQGRISLNSVLLLLPVNFGSGFRLKLMYISLIVSIRSTLAHLHGFQLHALLSYVKEITFVCTNSINLLKLKFRQASDCCKRILEGAKLACTNKTKALRTFRKLLLVFSTKVNLLYLLYSTVWRCCLLHLTKQNCLLKTFLKTLILMSQSIPRNLALQTGSRAMV